MKGVLTFITEKSMHMSGISQINQINLAEGIGDGWVVLNKSPLICNFIILSEAIPIRKN